jgi:hypothetical protein
LWCLRQLGTVAKQVEDMAQLFRQSHQDTRMACAISAGALTAVVVYLATLAALLLATQAFCP